MPLTHSSRIGYWNIFHYLVVIGGLASASFGDDRFTITGGRMRLARKNYGLFSATLGLLLFTAGCNQTPEATTDLESIGLLRGDIALCGNPEFGEISFALACTPAVQESFGLALSLLHSFEYTEAEKAFVQVIDQDPSCVMAYWGVAMSNFHSLWLQSGTDYLEKGSKVLEAAAGLPKSEREADYINAIAAFYDDWENTDRTTRISNFEKAMRQVYEKYDQDKEAAVFYALALTASADPSDQTFKKQIRSAKILESIFPDQPNHPGIAHYIIHNYDYPGLAERALPTARRYAEIAPSSAHAQHMPSHIFTRLGLWDESIMSNLNSTSSALCYSESIDPEAHWDEELHGIDYLVYAYLQTGDTQRAMEQYEYLKTFKKVFPPNFKIAYTAAAVPTRIALETRDWAAAAQLELPMIGIEWENFPWQEAILHFGRALGAIHSNNLDAAKKELEVMEGLRTKLLTQKDDYKANQVHIQIKTTRAWIALADGESEKAVQLMTEAAEMEKKTAKHPVTPGEVLPADELLGDLLMEAGDPNAALSAYEDDLDRHPNRFNGVFGAAAAAAAVQDRARAVQYYTQLMDLTKNNQSTRKEIAMAQAYLKTAN